MQAIGETLAAMHQAQQQPQTQVQMPQMPRDKRTEFMRGCNTLNLGYNFLSNIHQIQVLPSLFFALLLFL
jgi:hypothetical protein